MTYNRGAKFRPKETNSEKIKRLERQNTDLQANNTKLMLENRALKYKLLQNPDEFEQQTRGMELFAIALGFEHTIKNGFHILKGHGFTYRHIGLLNIATRIKYAIEQNLLTHKCEAANDDGDTAVTLIQIPRKKLEQMRRLNGGKRMEGLPSYHRVEGWNQLIDELLEGENNV